MPLYEYRCSMCGTVVDQLRPSSSRDCLRVCECKRGILGRVTSMPGGLLTAGVSERPRIVTPSGSRPNVTIRDCHIDNCGTGIRMDGGHADIDGLAVTNTPVAFELNNGATVNGRNVQHLVGSRAQERPKQSAERWRLPRPRKKLSDGAP